MIHDRPEHLVFVTGLGRSGTTFLAKLIDSAPEILYRHEPDAALPTNLPVLIGRDQLMRHLPEARAYLGAMASCRRLRTVGHVPVFRKAYRSSLANLAVRPMVISSKLLQKLRLPWPHTLPDLITGERKDVVHLIKSVSSLGRFRLFAEAWPTMASIHITRHPCAVFASTRVGIDQGVMSSNVFLRSLFAQEEAANYPFSLEDMQNATFEEQVAYRWMLLNDKAAADMEAASRYLRVGYEDLCTNVDRVSRQVFDHIGITLSAQTKHFIQEISRPSEHATGKRGYFRVQRPIKSALDKWKTQLDPDCVTRIREIVSHSPLGRAYFQESATPKTAASAC